MPESIGKRFRRVRRAVGRTQAELAARAGCSVSTIYRIETADHQPSVRLLSRLAAALGVDAGYLLEGR